MTDQRTEEEIVRQLADEDRQRRAAEVRHELLLRDVIARLSQVAPFDPGCCTVCFQPFELTEKGRIDHVCAGPPPTRREVIRHALEARPPAPPEDVRPGSSHD